MAPTTPPDQPGAGNPPTVPLEKPLEAPAAAAPPAEGDGKADAPKSVRLVPADWTVNSVHFTIGEGKDAEDVAITANRPGNTPYIVPAEAADELIVAAAERGLAVTKETSR